MTEQLRQLNDSTAPSFESLADVYAKSEFCNTKAELLDKNLKVTQKELFDLKKVAEKHNERLYSADAGLVELRERWEESSAYTTLCRKKGFFSAFQELSNRS